MLSLFLLILPYLFSAITGFFYAMHLMEQKAQREKEALEAQIDWAYPRLNKVSRKKFSDRFFPLLKYSSSPLNPWTYRVSHAYPVAHSETPVNCVSSGNSIKKAAKVIKKYGKLPKK